MIRLLKYDWKRNATFLLSSIVLFVLLQIGVELFVSNKEAALALMVMGYAAITVIVTVCAVRTYARNIISTSRRMLPVSSLQHILSPLVLGLLGSFLISLVLMLHVSYSSTFKAFEPLQVLADFYPGSRLMVILAVLEAALFQLVVFFLAYTIGRSFQTKGRAAIMVIAYLILQNGLAWIEDALGLQQFGMMEFSLAEGYSQSANPAPGVFSSIGRQALYGSAVFELVCSVIMIGVMVKLLDKRVEVK